MPCHTALGKVPLVLKPFANCAIDESPETVVELIPIPENKLSLIHCLPPTCPAGITTKSFHLRFASPYAELAKIYRIQPDVWTFEKLALLDRAESKTRLR
jgi:hypothetical protein